MEKCGLCGADVPAPAFARWPEHLNGCTRSPRCLCGKLKAKNSDQCAACRRAAAKKEKPC